MKKKIHTRKDFYETGELKRTTQVNEADKREGIQQEFYRNGKLKSRERFSDGYTVFRRVYWPNGNTKEQYGKRKGQWVQKIRNGKGKLVSHTTFNEEMLRSRKLSTMVHRAFAMKCWEIDNADILKRQQKKNIS